MVTFDDNLDCDVLVRDGANGTTVEIPTPPTHEVTINMEPMIDDVPKKVCELSLQRMVANKIFLRSYVEFKYCSVSEHNFQQ